MSYTITDIKCHLKACGIDSENGIVVSSGVLAAHNLRRAQDIDIVVTADKFKQLQATGLFNLAYFQDGAPCLRMGSMEIFVKWDQPGDTKPNFSDLYKDSELISDVRFLKLERVKQWKTRWSRPKDVQDLELIEAKY